MQFSRFLDAWCKDWIALMSGIVSVGLLFWATLWPPSQAEGKQVLLVLSALCFVVGSYRIWAKQYQRVCDLTGKTQTEAVEDLLSEFQSLESWYASDEKTNSKPLERLIEKSLDELRHHVPLAVYRFKKVATNPTPHPASFFPQTGGDRTIQQLADWRSDKEREQCWRKVSACLNSLQDISRELPH
jgi:hypothetical protein